MATPAAAMRKNLYGLFLAHGVLMVGHGLLGLLIPLYLVHAGSTAFATAAFQSCYYAGFTLGVMSNTALIDRVGPHRALIAFSGIAALVTVGFNLTATLLVWALFRFFSGVAIAGIFAAVESHIHASVSNTDRGRIFSAYLTINYLGLGLGQLLAGTGTAGQVQQMSMVTMLFILGIFPLIFLDGEAPRSLRLTEPRVARLFLGHVRAVSEYVPLTIPGCLLIGFLYGAFYALMPVVLLQTGFAVSEMSDFMGAALAAALAAQIPIGKISDRMDRRWLIFWISAISMLLSMSLAIFRDSRYFTVTALAYVAITFTSYGTLMSHVNDRADPARRTGITVEMLSLFSIGGIIGPLLASLLMSDLGPAGLFVFNGITASVMAISALVALRRGING